MLLLSGGGIERVKRRLLSQVVEHRISALSEALKYDKEGLRLLIQALSDPEILVQLTAYKLLQNREELEVKFTLQNYKIYFLPHVYGLYKTLFT